MKLFTLLALLFAVVAFGERQGHEASRHGRQSRGSLGSRLMGSGVKDRIMHYNDNNNEQHPPQYPQHPEHHTMQESSMEQPVMANEYGQVPNQMEHEHEHPPQRPQRPQRPQKPGNAQEGEEGEGRQAQRPPRPRGAKGPQQHERPHPRTGSLRQNNLGRIRIDDGKIISSDVGRRHDDNSNINDINDINDDVNPAADDSNSFNKFTKVNFIDFNKDKDNKIVNIIDDVIDVVDDIRDVTDGINIKLGFSGVPTITFCNTTSTPLVINSYTISPDDIEPNEDVTLTLKTTLVGETVTSGKIDVDAKVDKFPIIDQSYDLCTEIQQAGLSCPLAPGPYDISQTIDIPSIPISGTVDATAKLYDQSSNELACIEVVVSV